MPVAGSNRLDRSVVREMVGMAFSAASSTEPPYVGLLTTSGSIP